MPKKKNTKRLQRVGMQNTKKKRWQKDMMVGLMFHLLEHR